MRADAPSFVPKQSVCVQNDQVQVLNQASGGSETQKCSRRKNNNMRKPEKKRNSNSNSNSRQRKKESRLPNNRNAASRTPRTDTLEKDKDDPKQNTGARECETRRRRRQHKKGSSPQDSCSPSSAQHNFARRHASTRTCTTEAEAEAEAEAEIVKTGKGGHTSTSTTRSHGNASTIKNSTSTCKRRSRKSTRHKRQHKNANAPPDTDNALVDQEEEPFSDKSFPSLSLSSSLPLQQARESVRALSQFQNPKEEQSNTLQTSASASALALASSSASQGIWSQVACVGYEQSEQKRIHHLGELAKKQHELETFTRMDVLTSTGASASAMTLKNNDAGGDGGVQGKDLASMDAEIEEIESDVLKQPDGTCIQGNSTARTCTPSVSVVGKLLNVEKLRRRWSVALEKKRQMEEERRILQAETIETYQEEVAAHGLISTIYSSDDELSTCSTDDGNRTHGSSDDESIGESITTRTSCSSTHDSTCTGQSFWAAIESRHGHYIQKEFPLHYAILGNDEAAVVDLMRLPPEITLRDERVSVEDLEIPDTCELPPAVLVHMKPVSSSSQLRTRVSIVQLAILLHRPNLLRRLLSYSSHLKFVTSTFALDDLDDCRRTPLMLACEFSLDAIIQVLLSYGSKVTSKHQKTGDCALHIACRHSEASTVKRILGSGSDRTSATRQRLICSRNRMGQTPLHIACSIGRFDILNTLLSNSVPASIDKALSIDDHCGRTPLFTAISAGATEIVMHLMTRRVNQRNNIPIVQGCPLSLAVTTKSMEMVYLLLDCRPLSVFHTFDYTEALSQVICCFDDSSEDAYELIDLFVEEGADPHSMTTFAQNSASDEHFNSMLRNRPLAYATMKGYVKCVARMLDSYKVTQSNRMRLLHEDPVLSKQPLSYFLSIEKQEKEKVAKSLEDTLVNALQLVVATEEDDYLSTRQFGSCLAILRRGGALDDSAFTRILRGFWPRKVNSGDVLAPDEVIFEGYYSHIKAAKRDASNVLTGSSPYRHFHLPFSQSWSSCLSELSWVWQSASFYEDISCRYMKETLLSHIDKEGHSPHDEDTCFLIVEGQRLRAHKSILSYKSGKFEAAIRFADMNSCNVDHASSITEVSLDTPLRYVRLLVTHCYHGSIVTGLSSDLTQCVQELLDLYLIAQEFLCPSLSLECEMRLLSATPYRCYCWNCCDRVEANTRMNGTEDDMVCFYDVEVSKYMCSIDSNIPRNTTVRVHVIYNS